MRDAATEGEGQERSKGHSVDVFLKINGNSTLFPPHSHFLFTIPNSIPLCPTQALPSLLYLFTLFYTLPNFPHRCLTLPLPCHSSLTPPPPASLSLSSLTLQSPSHSHFLFLSPLSIPLTPLPLPSLSLTLTLSLPFPLPHPSLSSPSHSPLPSPFLPSFSLP